MSSIVIIDFGDLRDCARVNAEAFRNWFPAVPLARALYVDGKGMVQDVYGQLSSRYDISKSAVLHTLQLLFRHLEVHFLHAHGETRLRVATTLADLLTRDLRTVWKSKGLYHTRQAFVILAFLAEGYESVLLAGALLEFWFSHVPALVQDHEEYHWQWQTALRKLNGVGPDGMVGLSAHAGLAPLVTMPHHDWQRGRLPGRAGIPWVDNRALSAPVTRYGGRPNLHLTLPISTDSAWTSPIMSPAQFPTTEYLDNISRLQWQQEEVNAKLDNIDSKVDRLLEYDRF